MEKITERENFLRMLRHERPDFMPHQPSLLQMIIPSAIGDRAETAGRDTTGSACIGPRIPTCP